MNFAIQINDNRQGTQTSSNNPQANNIRNNNNEINQPDQNNATGQEQIDFTNFLQHANHPCVVLFTLLFKAGSIVSFLFLNLFLSNEALVFIIVVILSAFDFWFVKNVSGR